MTPILSSEIREAIAKIDDDCRRLMFGDDKTVATIYEILAATRAQDTDVAEALTVGMFGDGYMLSHQRRLLAIVAAGALSEVASLVQRAEWWEAETRRVLQAVCAEDVDTVERVTRLALNFRPANEANPPPKASDHTRTYREENRPARSTLSETPQ